MKNVAIDQSALVIPESHAITCHLTAYAYQHKCFHFNRQHASYSDKECLNISWFSRSTACITLNNWTMWLLRVKYLCIFCKIREEWILWLNSTQNTEVSLFTHDCDCIVAEILPDFWWRFRTALKPNWLQVLKQCLCWGLECRRMTEKQKWVRSDEASQPHTERVTWSQIMVQKVIQMNLWRAMSSCNHLHFAWTRSPLSACA